MISTLLMVICLGSTGNQCDSSQVWTVDQYDGPRAPTVCEAAANLANLEERENPHTFKRKFYCESGPDGE